MGVTFELTADDVWRYALYCRRHRTPLLYTFVGLICIVLAMLVSLLVASVAALGVNRSASEIGGGGGTWVLLITCATVFYCLTLLLPTKKRIAQVAARKPGVLGGHTFGIHAQRFYDRTDVGEAEASWSNLQLIENNADYCFFFMSTSEGFIIPKRAFATLNEAQAFLELARRYWEAAKTGRPLPAEEADVWPPPPQSLSGE